MSLITRKQQDIIDDAISSYIKNYDKVALQYVKLRQEIYEITSTIVRKIINEESIDADKIKLAKIRYESDKIVEIYKLHIKKLTQNVEIQKTIDPPYLKKLETEYTILANTKQDLIEQIKDLKNDKKPLIDDMRSLTSNFLKDVIKKTSKLKSIYKIDDISLKSNSNSRTIDLSSSVFSYDELKELFTDINNQLRKLKTIDEIDNLNNTTNNTTTSHSLNILKYLDDHISNNESFKQVGDDKFLYDISKATASVSNNSLNVIDEYDKSIQSLTINIKDLIEHGAEAKERWSLNAKKLEKVKETLELFDDNMELDG